MKVKVKPGDHTFEVRATDKAGNVEKDPASFSWTVKAASDSGTAGQIRQVGGSG